MARFRKFKAPKITTVIGVGTSISGDVKFVGGLHVDGAIFGNVQSESEGHSAFTLSEQGSVEGDIQVPNVILNGNVVGDVYASERVELAPKAKVTGTVYYNLLEMAMGAEVNGQLIHSEEPEPKMLGYDGGGEPEVIEEERVQSPAEDEIGETGQVLHRPPRGR